jgi:hypothetical protein
MYRQIAKNGFATLADMEEDIESSTTLNTMSMYLLASGISSDLVNKGLKTSYTINQQIKGK